MQEQREKNGHMMGNRLKNETNYHLSYNYIHISNIASHSGSSSGNTDSSEYSAAAALNICHVLTAIVGVLYNVKIGNLCADTFHTTSTTDAVAAEMMSLSFPPVLPLELINKRMNH